MNTTFAEDSLPGVNVVLTLVTISINNILSLPLNGYVMWLIFTGETLASDFFSLNLAMSEILFSLSTIWYLVFLQIKLFFSFEAYMFSNGLLYTARPLFQCCICVECYVGVARPMLFLRIKPLRYRVSCCCVAWLIALVSCIYSWHTYANPLYLYAFFIQNILFFSIMLFCCLSVLWALKRPGPGDKRTDKKRSNAMKRKAFKIIFFILISMSINFFLYVASVPMQCCLPGFGNILSICMSIALTTGFIQPLLYLHRNGKLPCFRKF